MNEPKTTTLILHYYKLFQYGISKIDDTIRARRYIEWCAKNNKQLNFGGTSIPYFGNHTDDQLKIGHTDVNKAVKKVVLNEWILDCFEEESGTDKDPYSRKLKDYHLVFDIKIEQLAEKYKLGIGKKGYILEDIWEKCKQVHEGTLYSWHDDGFEEEE
ncbi:hypothetical protein Tco_0675199 [Tanacetum coccineum]